jgi:predicted nuclease with TOPRIM domain
MGMFDFLKNASNNAVSDEELRSCKSRLSTLEKQNVELAKKIVQLSASLEQTRQLLNVVAVANAELARDMKTIYDALQSVVVHTVDADDQLDEMLLPFGWPKKDDDDLPN